MIKDFIDEFLRYKLMGQKAFAQVSDENLNKVFASDMNSVAMIVRHIGGNLISRFTDFLTTDGEKPWRDREAEFAEKEYSRSEMLQLWAQGWHVLESELALLTDADLGKQVTIRGQAFTVHEALARSIAHIAYHIGQIILLARLQASGAWQWISVPKGKSAEYNQNPTMEKRPL